MIHLDLPQLQHLGAGGPGCGGRELQAGVSFRLQSEAQGPEVVSVIGGVELQTGPRCRHVAGHTLTPVVAGGGETLGVFVRQLDHA